MHSLLTHADILHYVLLQLNSKDWLDLARVSKSFFGCATPLIWRRVDGVQNILALIPGVEIKRSNTRPKRITSMSVNHTRHLDLARFQLYAPLVRSLEIYDNDANEYEVLNWQRLAQCAKEGPLLPNLICLTLTAPFEIMDRHQLLWIRMFLAPSIYEIHVSDRKKRSMIHTPWALSLFHHISEISPDIRQLSIYIEGRDDEYWDTEGEDSDMMGFWEPSLQSSFSVLKSLREISSTSALLTPEVFPAIASLGNLEVLNIRGSDGANIYEFIPQETLPTIPFPALKTFSWLDTEDSSEIWIILSGPTFHRLSSLQLGILDVPTEVDHQRPSYWHHELILLVVKACPQLIDLDIEFVEDDLCSLLEVTEGSKGGENMLLSMSHLPLEAVRLAWVYFGDNALSGLNSNDLVRAWPLVTRLNLPHARAGLEGLYKLSRLPKLEELTIEVYFEEDGTLEGNFFDRPAGCLSLHTLKVSICTLFYNEFETEEAARALLHCWPNIQTYELDIGTDSDIEEIDEDFIHLTNQINEAVQELQESNSRSSSERSGDSE